MNTLVVEIATASKEQRQGLGQINGAVSQMDKITQSNAAHAEETAAASVDLRSQSAAMLESVLELNRLVGGTVASDAPAQPRAATSAPAASHGAPRKPAPAARRAAGEQSAASSPDGAEFCRHT